MNRSPLYILSLRHRLPHPAQGCVTELEEVFAATMGGTLFAPVSDAEFGDFAQRVAGQHADLFIAAISLTNATQALRLIKGWRELFGQVFFYIFDSFLPDSEKRKSPWKKRLSSFTQTIAQVDHLFIPVQQEVQPLADFYGVAVTHLPLATDVVQFGTAQSNRPIDVNAYGRQQVEHVDALADRYNRQDSGRALHYTSHLSIARVNDMRRHRAFFWKMLSMSRLALAYDPKIVDPGQRRLAHSFVGQRWFESLAAGCVVVGLRPDCPETTQLLDWPDATLECPSDTAQFVDFIEALLQDTGRLDRARIANVAQMRARHDWGHRIQQMAEMLQRPVPDALHQRLAQLSPA